MDKYARFEAWLKENGARFEQLELREYDCGGGSSNKTAAEMNAPSSMGEEKKETSTGCDTDECEEEESEMRGVHARQHVPPNTICMSIPRRCLITVEMGQATPIGQAIYNSDLDLDAPKHIYLMIYILWDRKVHGRNSFFAPYYDILPPTLKNMPIFWTEEEMAGLQGSYLLHQIADRNQAIAEDYQTICSIAPLSQICTLDEFKWARMCVCSRNFGLQMDGHRTSALVPHADMLNHYRPRETKWTFDEDRNAFTITSLQHIPAGSQVYDSYGQKCNHRFLLNYGFAVEENREVDGFCPNEVPLELYVDPEDPNFSEKVEFWTRGEVNNPAIAALANSGVITNAIVTQAAQHALQASEKQSRASARKAFPGSSKNSHEVGRKFNAYTNYPRYDLQQQRQQHQSGQYHGVSTVVKRVRVCVSNNENTRLLFSLLRALACNEAELRAISTPMSATSSGGSESAASRALFGIPEPLRSTQQNHSFVLTGTPTPTAYFRSCRDIRHPISLRNERAAMRLLLEIVGRHLSLYPTTLAQDVADLMDEQSFPRFSNKRHAKIQVRGEKEVLHHYALWARAALDVLDVIAEELEEEHQQSTSVEVKLTRTGKMVTEETRTGMGFEYVIRRMGDDCDSDGGTHHSILRYCADVLGSLRREESKNLKRMRSLRTRDTRSTAVSSSSFM